MNLTIILLKNLKPQIFEIIMEHYVSEAPLFTDEVEPEVGKT